MRLQENVLRGLAVAKHLKESSGPVNSLHFAPDGLSLLSSSDGDSIVMYDCESGSPRLTLNSKKYGCSLIKYTHDKNAAVHASTKVDHTLRLLSLDSNKYIRYFKGHTERVTSLAESPSSDSFLSGSLDRSVRLWDMRASHGQGLMVNVGADPVVTVGPDGLVFAVGISADVIKLFDLRTFGRGAFATFTKTAAVPAHPAARLAGLTFSPDGRFLAASSSRDVIDVFDAFDGRVVRSLGGRQNSGLTLDCCFTPDSHFLLSGSTDSKVHVWAADSGLKSCTLLYSKHTHPVSRVAFNPRFVMMVTACLDIAFWLPAGN